VTSVFGEYGSCRESIWSVVADVWGSDMELGRPFTHLHHFVVVVVTVLSKLIP
jgi:hypothetical protein